MSATERVTVEFAFPGSVKPLRIKRVHGEGYLVAPGLAVAHAPTGHRLVNRRPWQIIHLNSGSLLTTVDFRSRKLAAEAAQLLVATGIRWDRVSERPSRATHRKAAPALVAIGEKYRRRRAKR